MKAKNKKALHFWGPFIINIFITCSVTFFIVSIGFSIGTRLDIVNNEKLNTLWGLFLFISINVTLASIFTCIIGVH